MGKNVPTAVPARRPRKRKRAFKVVRLRFIIFSGKQTFYHIFTHYGIQYELTSDQLPAELIYSSVGRTVGVFEQIPLRA